MARTARNKLSIAVRRGGVGHAAGHEARSKLQSQPLRKILTVIEPLSACACRLLKPSRNRSEGADAHVLLEHIGMSARSTKSINPLNSSSSFP